MQPALFSAPSVRGFLHPAEGQPQRAGDFLVLTHGAGSDCRSRLLVSVAEAFAAAGIAVLRCDLPFRQARPSGPPRTGDAAADRDGLRAAIAVMRERYPGRAYLGGHSYGGRQSSILAAAENGLAAALLLLSYPLHPPNRPEQLRTAHFPGLRMPVLFVHGARDPFGTLEEMRAAIALIPGSVSLLPVEGAGHDLARPGVPARSVEAFLSLVSGELG